MFVFYEWPFPFANNVANIVFFLLILGSVFSNCVDFLGGGGLLLGRITQLNAECCYRRCTFLGLLTYVCMH